MVERLTVTQPMQIYRGWVEMFGKLLQNFTELGIRCAHCFFFPVRPLEGIVVRQATLP
jgi:hypothetical protein